MVLLSTSVLPDIVINEAAKHAFDWESAEGKIIPINYDGKFGKVRGVAHDFHYQYPLYRIAPLLIVKREQWYDRTWKHITVRLRPDAGQTDIQQIENVWKTVFPRLPFSAQYLETLLTQQHEDAILPFEISLKIATAFALFVSCLGLFGLTSYETTRRTKEIGIRKAIGAKSWQIVAHFVRSFLWLLVLANIIAWPLALALFRLGAQLLRYPYPFDIGAVVFLQAGIISTLLTVITVSIQTLRAALVNPVNALRYE